MACAASTPHQAATVPQHRLFDSLQTIALDPICPCGLPADLRRIDLGRGKFDSLITAELSHAGYRVVPAAESQAIWDRLADSLGGLFDRASGQIDSVRLTTVRAGTLRELRERFHADAWLHPLIVIASAHFKSGTAKWDGTKQVFGKKFLGLNLESGYGTTPALSLDVIIETMQELLHSVAGTRQLRSFRERATLDILHRHKRYQFLVRVIDAFGVFRLDLVRINESN